MLYILLYQKMYPWMELLLMTNKVGMTIVSEIT